LAYILVRLFFMGWTWTAVRVLYGNWREVCTQTSAGTQLLCMCTMVAERCRRGHVIPITCLNDLIITRRRGRQADHAQFRQTCMHGDTAYSVHFLSSAQGQLHHAWTKLPAKSLHASPTTRKGLPTKSMSNDLQEHGTNRSIEVQWITSIIGSQWCDAASNPYIDVQFSPLVKSINQMTAHE